MDEPVSVRKTVLDDAQPSMTGDISTQDKQLRTIFDTMQAGIILVSPKGIITLANQRMADMFRCSIEELVGSPYSDYLHPEQHHVGEEKMLRLIAGEIDHVHHERLYMRKDGSHFWGHLSGRRHEDAEGNLISLVGVIADITETKQAEEELKKREQQFSSLADNLPDVVARIDRNHRHVYVNRQAEMITGIPVSVYLGKTNRELGMPPELVELWEPTVNRVFESGQSAHVDFSFETAEGTKHFESRIVPELGKDGTIDTVLCIAQDITERKRSEAALDYAMQCFTQTLNSSQHILYRLNVKKGGYDYLSPVLESITGYPVAEFSKTSFEQLPGYFHPEDRQRIFSQIEEALRTRTGKFVNFDLEYRFRKADGSYCWLHDVNTACFDDHDQLECFFGSALDITERKLSEAILRESELKFRTLFATLQDALFLTAAEDGRIIECNDKLSGYSREELLGKTTLELGLWADWNEREQVVDLIKANGRVNDFEASFRRKDGTVFAGSISTNPVFINGRTLLLSVVRDISERYIFQNALRQSEQRYRALFDTMHEGFALHEIICNTDGQPVDYRFLQVNGAFEQLTGFSRASLIGSTVLEVMPDTEPTWIATCGQVALTGEPAIIEYYAKQLDRYYDVHVYQSSPSQFTALYSDVTERKILQQEREKAQRLSSLGVLAGGIAHDFNNILTGIIGNISLATMMVGKEHKAVERLKDCQNAAHRAAELTQQLITFSRGGEPVRKVVDASRLINETLHFCMRGSNVRGELDCAPDLWKINADAGQIHQVLNNLLINARQSMEMGGTVMVKAENCEIHKGDPRRYAPGRYIRIIVQDEGCGIPAADLEHIFDPYFTTKKFGTGLGLTSVYSIIRRHGGQVQVSSIVGQGTTFTVYLPALTYAVEDVPEQTRKENVLPGSGRILVMDDEKMIRKLAAAMLRESGYEVESCEDGAQAVEQFIQARKEGKPFDVVILDLTVPGGMGGKEAAELIREQDRDVVLIVSSGYSSDDIMADYLSYGFNAAVAKPYTIQNITGEVSRMLAERRP